MSIKSIIIQVTRSSSSIRNSPHSSKISYFLSFNQSSLFSRFTALEFIWPLLSSPQNCSYHANVENAEEPNSSKRSSSLVASISSSVTPNSNWVDNPNNNNDPTNGEKTEEPKSSRSSLTCSVNPNTDWVDNLNNNNDPTLKNPRGSTPIGRKFESWIKSLKPGFQPQEVAHVLKQQTDPDLAYDIFQWTAQQRNYRHNHRTYQIMIETLASALRRKKMEQLMEEVMAGACIGIEPLFNTMINNYCQFRMLGPAIAVYKKMQKVPGCKPTVRTYNLLFHAIVRRFGSFTVCCVHLRTVKSLYQQMNAAGVDPDLTTLNLLIKAHSMAMEMDQAVKFYREMGLYGCSPDFYTYNYIIRGFSQKGCMKQALEFYGIMIGKGLCPSRGVYNVLVCSLSVGGKLEEAMNVLQEMANNRLLPDFLTYKTLVENLCNEGKGEKAFQFLCGLRSKGYVLDETTYIRLVNIFKLIQ